MRFVKRFGKGTISEKVVRFFAALVLNIWALSLLYPLFFGFNAALKENGRAFMSNPVSLVIFKNPEWENFSRAFDEIAYNDIGFLRMAFNSFFFATIPNLVALFFTALIGYIVCKYKKYRIMKHIYSLILLVTFLPIYGNLSATYKLFYQLGFFESYTIMIASFGVSYGNFLYTHAFFKGVPWEYAESAFIDGAGHWKVFLKIMLPQIIPSLAVVFIGSFIATWNDFQGCMLYHSETIPTLSFGIYVFYEKSIYMASQPIYMAACLLASVPSIILFLLFQKEMMTKLTFSGVKG